MRSHLALILAGALLSACSTVLSSSVQRSVEGTPLLAIAPEIVEVAVAPRGFYRWHGKVWSAAQLQAALEKDLSFRPVSEIRILDTGGPITIGNILEVGAIAKAVGAKATYSDDGESKSINFEDVGAAEGLAPETEKLLSAIEWSTAVSKHLTEDRAIIYRYVSKLRDDFERSSQPAMMLVTWAYQGEDGMPSSAERERMGRLEDLLAPRLEATGLATLALVTTGKNFREWMYYAKSSEEFMRQLNLALGSESSYPIETDFRHEPSWNSYEEFRAGIEGRK